MNGAGLEDDGAMNGAINDAGLVEGVIKDAAINDAESESKFSSQSLPSSQSSSSESLFTNENPVDDRLDASAPTARPACNTCEHLDASVHCHACGRAYCNYCAVTPSTAGLPWSCFRCQLSEATRTDVTRPKARTVRVVGIGKRKPSLEPLAKRRRSNR